MWVNRLQRAAKVSKQETRIFTEVYRSRMEPGLLKWPDVDPQVHSKILKARGVTPVHKEFKKKRNNLLNCKKCNNSHNTDVFQKTKRARLPSHSLCLSWKSCTRSDHLTNLDGVFGVKKQEVYDRCTQNIFFVWKVGDPQHAYRPAATQHQHRWPPAKSSLKGRVKSGCVLQRRALADCISALFSAAWVS